MLRWNPEVDPTNWARTPIDRIVWNDDGFDQHPVVENHDAMVVINDQIAVWAEEAFGACFKITPLSGTGFGASPLITVREPVLEAMVAINNVLARLGLELLVVCGHRGPRIQGNGFASRFWEQSEPHDPAQRVEIIGEMPTADFLERAYAIHKGYLSAGVVEDAAYQRMIQVALTGVHASALAQLAEKFGKPVEKVAGWFVKYIANLKPGYLRLDGRANKPHGTGGSIDATLKRLDDGPVFTGSPSGDAKSVARVLHYFEKYDLAHYRNEVATHPNLQRYVSDFADEFGTDEVTQEHFDMARANIRILYWAMRLVANATGYNENDVDGEWWHWNIGTSFDGPGNGCHQICLGRSEPAVWGAEFAHEQVAALVGAEYVY